ncbi:hypothetical protein PUN28_004451 [Cardiocondyla obscurior]|uniref:Uncharacterized protein n=1 Tax=Cardiocondyla obscurior TaxID=286306 RepID=A0AAW2GFX7_9HYME
MFPVKQPPFPINVEGETDDDEKKKEKKKLSHLCACDEIHSRYVIGEVHAIEPNMHVLKANTKPSRVRDYFSTFKVHFILFSLSLSLSLPPKVSRSARNAESG